MFGFSGKEKELKKLKQRAELLSKFYIKGFTHVVWAAGWNYLAYAGGTQRVRSKDEYAQRLQQNNRQLQELYSPKKINLKGLENDEDFAPLFATKILLDKFVKIIERGLEGKAEEFDAISVRAGVEAICEVGRVYEKTYKGLLEKISSLSGGNYWIPLTDIHGNVWD